MIKLIAADMDGTLLNSQKELPAGFGEMLGALREAGIHFAAASGRQYYNLAAQFGDAAMEMPIICENGTMVFDRGVPVFLDEIPREDWQQLVRMLREIPGASPILCCPEGAYCEDRSELFDQNAAMYYTRLCRVPDLLAVPSPVCKVAVFDSRGAEQNSYPAMKAAAKGFQVALSGELWTDIMGNSNKGTALSALERELGVLPEETMAFGDYLNDLEMMDACYYSCAMENAHPDLKARARFVVGSNDRDGVLEAVRKMTGVGNGGFAVRQVPFQSPEYRESLLLRDKILRKPLGLSLFEEDLSAEAGYLHLCAFQDGKVIGTAVLLPGETPEEMRVRQVAVDTSFRGKGTGARLMQLAERLAAQRGIKRLRLHARRTAEGFYEKLGWKPEGEPFAEVGIPHIGMKKELLYKNSAVLPL